MTIQLSPEQRARVIAELASRSKPADQCTDEELMERMQRGHALSMELDPEYRAAHAPKPKAGKKKAAREESAA